MTDKSEEFMVVCRTPAQVCDEHIAEVLAERERLAAREKEIARKIDDYIYSTLKPYASTIIKMCSISLTFNDGSSLSWSVPVCKSREEYDRRGGIADYMYHYEKRATELVRNWPSIKKAFHKKLELTLQKVADRMHSEAERLTAREAAIESFKI